MLKELKINIDYMYKVVHVKGEGKLGSGYDKIVNLLKEYIHYLLLLEEIYTYYRRYIKNNVNSI
jgi:hypothetical protein